MEKQYKICQICGMPMSKDPKSGGTNADGSKNMKYCCFCLQKGDFTFNGPVQEFQEFCRQKMIESGHNKFKGWFYTLGMKRLERWKSIQ